MYIKKGPDSRATTPLQLVASSNGTKFNNYSEKVTNAPAAKDSTNAAIDIELWVSELAEEDVGLGTPLPPLPLPLPVPLPALLLLVGNGTPVWVNVAEEGLPVPAGVPEPPALVDN